MSLTDGLSKMSKSAPSDQSRINLLDSKDVSKMNSLMFFVCVLVLLLNPFLIPPFENS
jgi:hypothetical protein